MTFNSFEFLLFLPLVVILFYLLPHKYRWALLLLASYYFYMAHEPTLVLLLLISTLVDYYCGLYMGGTDDKGRNKLLLGISITVNLGLLFMFKYWYFFLYNFNEVAGFFGVVEAETNNINTYNIDQILLPVGISFYTFQTMSYTIEVYRGNLKPETHFGRFALYVAFFPQLVAGPIEKATRFLPQLKRKINLDLENIKRGLVLIGWGLFLKVVISDRLGIYVDEVFADPEKYRGMPLVVGSFFFSYQIYYDFSAYSTIAVGAAQTMGYNLIQNFNRPIFSTSSVAFWQRWHISLMQWMRDYLYRPLIKNAGLSRLWAVIIVFFIIGLWHGASWTFVVWSLLNVAFFIVEVATASWRARLLKKLGVPKKLEHFMGWVMVIGYLTLTLVVFRASSISHAYIYFRNMVRINNLNINILDNAFELWLSFLLIFIVQTIHYFKGNSRVYELVLHRPKVWRWSIYLAFIFIFVLFGINRQDTFIYFQF